MMTFIVIILSIYLSHRQNTYGYRNGEILADILPEGSRVMINDPSTLYYYTGISGVAFPNESPETALQIAEIYDIDYLVLESGGIPEPLKFDEVPDFLIPIETELGGVRVYAFDRD